MTDMNLLPLMDGHEENHLPAAPAPLNLSTGEETALGMPAMEISQTRCFVFAGRECRSLYDLAQAMGDAWEDARLALLGGALAQLLDTVDLGASAFCRELTAAIAEGCITPERAVLEAIHRFSGEKLVIWQGRRYADSVDLGGSLLQALRGTGVIPAHCDSLLMSGAASLFAEDAQRSGLGALEARYAAPDCTTREKICLMYMVGFLLCGMAAFVMEGETFYTVEQLAAWLEGCSRKSVAAFTRACHRLLDENHLLDPQMEAWLTALGRRQEVARWQAEMDAGML